MTKENIVLGAWAWGDQGSYFGNNYGEEHFKEVFDRAFDEGLRFWDTAYAYGAGASEKILGDLMKTKPRKELTISTKFTPQMADLNEAHPVEAMLEGSLERLGTDYVDYYWIHNDADVEKWTPQVIPLMKSGKIKHLGVSNHTLDEIKRVQEILNAEGLKLDAVQNHMSLLDRSSEKPGVLDYCKENGLTFFAYMVLEQGALSGKYTTESPFPTDSAREEKYNPILPQLTDLVTKMEEIGKAHDLSVAQVAMNLAISKGTLPIIGVTKTNQVDDAAKLANNKLTDQEISQLETLADKADVNTAGGWEPNYNK